MCVAWDASSILCFPFLPGGQYGETYLEKRHWSAGLKKIVCAAKWVDKP